MGKMTEQLTPDRSRQITQQLAQLYVDANSRNIEAHYEAITGEPLTPIQVFKIKETALDEFNLWLAKQRKQNG